MSLVAIAILLFTGPFCPQEGTTVPIVHSPFTLRLCDLDGDGYSDLVTANADTDDLAVALNGRDGSFTSPKLFPGGEEPVDVACCDLDGDGDLDVATANRQVSQVGIFINESVPGIVQLAPPTPFATGLAPWGVGCLDLNDDGRADVVTSNYTSESVSVLLNMGSGSFAAAIDLPTAADGTFHLATCDLDSDGDLDVVVSNLIGQSITSFRNDQNGSLTKIGTFSIGVGLFPWGISCCDVNGDGAMDAAAGISGDDLVAVMFNDGTGRFDNPELPPRTFGSGDQPFKLACCNVDDDGDVDVLTANLGSNDLVVLRNDEGTLTLSGSLPVGDNPGAVDCGKFARPISLLESSRQGDLVVAFVDGVEVFLNVCEGSGDADSDGDVDLQDVAFLQTCFGSPPALVCHAVELTQDSLIDLGDHAAMLPLVEGPGRE